MNERIKVESASEGKREGEKKSQLRLRPKSGKRIHNTRRPQVPFLSHMPSSSPHLSSSPPYSTLHFLVVLLSFIPTSPPTPHSSPVVLISLSLWLSSPFLHLFPRQSHPSLSPFFLFPLLSSPLFSLSSFSTTMPFHPLFLPLTLFSRSPSPLYSLLSRPYLLYYYLLSPLVVLLFPSRPPLLSNPSLFILSPSFPPLFPPPLLSFPPTPPPSPSLTLGDIFSSNYADGIEFDDGVPGREGSERKEARWLEWSREEDDVATSEDGNRLSGIGVLAEGRRAAEACAGWVICPRAGMWGVRRQASKQTDSDDWTSRQKVISKQIGNREKESKQIGNLVKERK